LSSTDLRGQPRPKNGSLVAITVRNRKLASRVRLAMEWRDRGGVMLRKQIIEVPPAAPDPMTGQIDVAAVATVLVTSEDPEHPIDHAFDGRRGPGATRWVAGETGEQTVILKFDAPQAIRRVALEVEEPGVARTQELQLAASHDGGLSYRELLRQEYNFSPPGTTFEREDWAVNAEGVTHLRLWIKPDKGGKPCRATITSLALR
jgi:hypothetical protein